MQNEAVVWMERLYQGVWWGDPREANDSQEEIQEHTVNQLQGQEGDPRLQRPSLLSDAGDCGKGLGVMRIMGGTFQDGVSIMAFFLWFVGLFQPV